MSDIDNIENDGLKEIVHVSGMYEDWLRLCFICNTRKGSSSYLRWF